ncbi:MAG: hypothetical protein JWQ21_1099 [Herminiimonas sp.]|nr:hypothetical protein [Herminiimonas sp.]
MIAAGRRLRPGHKRLVPANGRTGCCVKRSRYQKSSTVPLTGLVCNRFA